MLWVTPTTCSTVIWTCIMSAWNKANIFCGHLFLCCTFACVYAVLHTHSVQSPCWRIKVQNRPALNQWTIHEKSSALTQLHVCATWPVLSVRLNVTRLSLGQAFWYGSFKGTSECLTRLEPLEYDCLCWWCVRGARRRDRVMLVLELVGRLIVWVRAGCTQYGPVYECRVTVKGQAQTGFTVLCPLFIVQLMVPIILSGWILVGTVLGDGKYWNSQCYVQGQPEDWHSNGQYCILDWFLSSLWSCQTNNCEAKAFCETVNKKNHFIICASATTVHYFSLSIYVHLLKWM